MGSRGHDFEPRWSPEFFRLISNCSNCYSLRWSKATLRSNNYCWLVNCKMFFKNASLRTGKPGLFSGKAKDLLEIKVENYLQRRIKKDRDQSKRTNDDYLIVKKTRGFIFLDSVICSKSSSCCFISPCNSLRLFKNQSFIRNMVDAMSE